MPYYRAVGEIPASVTLSSACPTVSCTPRNSWGSRASPPTPRCCITGLPTAIVDSAVYEATPYTRTPNHPLKPRHLRTHKLDATGADAVTGRQHLFANEDVRISYVVVDRLSPLYRNAIGDECIYVEAGAATVETVFGAFDVATGDYVVIPTSTTHRWLPRIGDDDAEPAVASRSRQPDTSAAAALPLVEGAVPRIGTVLRARSAWTCEPMLTDGEDVEVLVQHRRGWTRFTYAHHPFDVVGWDGCLYPYAFNISDFEPITGRVHQPPPVHQTFEGPNFVICSFVPRKVDYHPLSIPVPYNHANVDSDEMMFYTGGNYEARKGSASSWVRSRCTRPGSRGPQPGSVERSLGVEAFEELAVMVDTFRPLDLCEAALACEDTGYAWTWAGRSLR